MDTIRCLIAELPQFLLADIIHKITESEPEINVIGYAAKYEEIKNALDSNEVDLVICGMDESNLNIVSDIFKLSENIAVLGLVNDGRRICLCFEGVGISSFLTLLKSVLNIRKI